MKITNEADKYWLAKPFFIFTTPLGRDEEIKHLLNALSEKVEYEKYL